MGVRRGRIGRLAPYATPQDVVGLIDSQRAFAPCPGNAGERERAFHFSKRTGPTMDWRLEPLILPFLIATLLLLALPKPGHPQSLAPGGGDAFGIAPRTSLAGADALAATVIPQQTVHQPKEKCHV